MRPCARAILAMALLFTDAGASAAGPDTPTTPLDMPAVYRAGGDARGRDTAAETIRDAARASGKVRIIVGFDTAIAMPESVGRAEFQAQKARFRDTADAFAERVYGQLPDSGRFKPFDRIPYAVMTVSPGELERVLADPDVANVQIDSVVPLTPRLLEMVKIVRAKSLWPKGVANQGKGHTIAIVDVGFDRNLPTLKSRIVHEACFSEKKHCWTTEYKDNKRRKKMIGAGAGWGCKKSALYYKIYNKNHKTKWYCKEHGTWTVSAALAAATKKGHYAGAAPGANLFFVRLDPTFGTLADLVTAYEHIIDKRTKYGIDTISMSVGFGRSDESCGGMFPAFEAVAATLTSAGVAMFNASGNEYSYDDVDYPGCLDNVVSVGASQESDKAIADFSDTSHLVSLVAPGNNVRLDGLGGDSPFTISGDSAKHGTSFATPIVAAGYTLLKEVFPDKTPDEIVTAMRCTGKTLSRTNSKVTLPRVDLAKAKNFLSDPTSELRWDFKGAKSAIGWVPLFERWEVENGNYILHEADETGIDAVLNDLCFENFELEARVQHYYKLAPGYDKNDLMGILLAKETKYAKEKSSDRLFNGIVAYFRSDEHDSPANAWITEYTDLSFTHSAGAAREVCRGGAPLPFDAFAKVKVKVVDGQVGLYLNGKFVCKGTADTSGLKTFGMIALLKKPDYSDPNIYVGPRFFRIDYVKTKGLE